MTRNRPELTRSGYRDRKKAILLHNPSCIWCGHGQCDAVDHILAAARGGTSELSNLAPIHGVAGCPTCGRKCNSEKGDKDVSERPERTSRDWYGEP